MADEQMIEDETPQDEKSYLNELKSRIKPPGDIETLMADAEDLREYVHTTAMLRDTDDTVGTNLVHRNLRATMAQFLPTDPAPVVRPKPRVTSIEAPIGIDPTVALHAQTHELLLKEQMEEGGLKGQIKAAARAGLVTRLGIIKMRWQEDFTRDAIGYSRINDTQDSVARYRALREAFEERKFDEESALHKQMMDLEPIVRKQVASDLAEDLAATPPPAQLDGVGQPMVNAEGQPIPAFDPRQQRIDELQAGATVELTELPEISAYQGPVWDVVDMEDFRWDWAITRAEDFYKSEWMANRVFLYPEQVRDKFGVDLEELRKEAHFYDDHGNVTKTADEDNLRDGDVDQTWMGRRIAVWEYWDRVQFRVVVWVEGMNRFVSDQIPEAATRRFFPFYPITLEPVDGRFLGQSLVHMLKGVQNDYNKLRTWDQELLRGSLPKFLVDQALLGNDPKRLAQDIEEALPFSFTPVQSPGELAKSIFTVTPQRYDPGALEHTRQLTLFDSQLLAGMPAAALGSPGGAQLATEAAIANEQMGVQTDDRRADVLMVYQFIFQDLMELNAQLLSAEEVAAKVGAGAVWPPMSTQEILSNLQVEAQAVPEEGPARKQSLETLLLVAQIFAQFGVGQFINPFEAAKLVTEKAGVEGDAARLLASPALAQALAGLGVPLGGASQQGQQARPPARESRPQDQGGRGAEGGRPNIQEPPRPESVPNNPVA